MNWDDLKLLLQVSRTEKLAEAAARLGQDATTLSRRLRRLETDLGVVLFERTRRGHVLTPDGAEIARRAERMEQSIQEIAAFGDGRSAETAALSGRIRLGVTEGLGTAVVAPAISDLTRKHPRLAVDLIAFPGYASVSKREADMAVTLARPQTGRLTARKLSDYTLQLYATKAYLSARPAIRRPEDLHDHVLIGYMDELLYAPQLRYYEEVSSGLTPKLCSPSIVAQLEMTRAGAGVAMLPRFMARRHPELTGVLHDDVDVTGSFWLITHEDIKGLARAKAVGEFLSDLISRRRRDLLRGG